MAMMLKTDCIAIGRLQAGVIFLCLVTVNFPKRNRRHNANKSDIIILLFFFLAKRLFFKRIKLM